MKGKIVLSLLTSAAVAAFWACGDDSGTSTEELVQQNTNLSSDSQQPSVPAVCSQIVAVENVHVLEGATPYVIYDNGDVTDAAGEKVGAFSDGNIIDFSMNILASGVDLDLTTACPQNATKTPTGEIVITSSAAVQPESSAGAVVGSSATLDAQSSGSVVAGSSTTVVPGSSAAVVPGSSDALVVESSSSAEPVKTVGNPEEDIKLYPVPTLKNILGNGTSGWNTRYWDACKAHCSQTSTDGAEGKPKINTQEEYAASHYTARVCNINDIEIPTFTYSKGLERYWVGIQNTPNACQEASPASGGGFTCTDMAPVAVNDTLAYAFVAGSDATTSCGKCFHLQYDGSFKDADGNNAPKETHKALKGKHIIVMASNIGHDVKPGQFDLMVPGGGPGIFNALQLQITKPGIEWGATYGGFLTYCQNGDQVGYDGALADYQKCVKKMCDAAFGDSNYPNLLRGCHWFADWFMAADNPTYQWEEVECPQYLVDKYTTTISTSIETKVLFQSDWSKYSGGDFIETDACSKTPNANGEYCDPDQLAADKAKTY